MKTLFLVVALLIPVSISFATEDPKNSDSTTNQAGDSVINEKFEFNIINQQLEVILSGNFDEHTFFSVTQLKGEDMHFQDVQSGENKIVIDISSLESGNYYLVLHSKDEIRMKRFFIA